MRSGASNNSTFGSSINLRGLGPTSTLTLYDGVRPALAGANGSFADISLIPSVAIDRIEVLTDGASAIYGTDAVAGVVNMRFRNRFEGFETRLRGATADGDFGDHQLGQIAGKRWSNGGAMVALEYTRSGRLAASDRPYVAEDLRPFGGPDYRSDYGNPGTIIADDGSIYGIPTGQNGTKLTAAQLIPGQQNRRDLQQAYDVLPSQKTLSGYASIDQDIGHGLSLFGNGFYARRSYDARQRQYGPSTVTVPVSNAFYVDPIGTHQPVSVDYDFLPDFGLETHSGMVNAFGLVGGVKADWAGWTIDLTGSYGHQRETLVRGNVINDTRLAAALADSNPATAFNVFGDGSNTNPTTIAAVRGSFSQASIAKNWSAGLHADGTLFDLPAGSVKLATGLDHRDERLAFSATSDRRATITHPMLAGLPGQRGINSIYGELSVPLLSPAMVSWFPGTLTLSLAGRIEHYSDFGTTRNPKIGLDWQPTPGLSVRASYGSSFRAPTFDELIGTSQNLYLPIALPDPKSPTGQTNVLELAGYPANLGPERTRTLTLGIDARPALVPGLTASATYFRIDYRDRLVSTSDDIFNYLVRRDVYQSLIQDNPPAALVASYYADPLFQNPFNIAASDIQAIVTGYTLNLARVVIDGFDFDIGYAHDLGSGKASIGVSGTRLFHINQRITPTAAVNDIVGMVGGPVKLRARGRASWSNDVFDASAFVNYTDGYTNQTVTPNEHIRPWTTVDLQVGVSVPAPGPAKSMRLSLSATNVFDRDPPYANLPLFDSALGYDPEQASAIGRVIAVQAIIGW
nr:TonB-dependent receptor [Sphingomonas sp.]